MSFQAQAIPALSEACSAQEYKLPRSTAGLCDTPAAQRWMWKGQSLLITSGFIQLNNYSRSTLRSGFPWGSVVVWMTDVLLTELGEDIFTKVK